MRSEGNSETTKIGWEVWLRRYWKNRLSAGVVVGMRRPASRGQAGKAQLSRSNPQGT